MMYRRELEKLKDKEGNVPHTLKSKNEFQGPSSNKTRVRTFRDNPKAIKHAQRIKMLQTFICPPLVVSSEGDLFSVRSLLDVAAKDKYTLELTEIGEIRIFPSDSCAYFDIAIMLLENDLPLRGLKQGGQDVFKAICLGLHPDEDVNAIQEALGALGHDVLQISKPADENFIPPTLPMYTITLERAENNWEIFNITKLLGMKVTIRPPPRVLPQPTCFNCFQLGHFGYECGRRLCESCNCSFVKGRNVIAKLAFEWPLTVKTRPRDSEEAKKQLKKLIRTSSDIIREQQLATDGSQGTTNEPNEAANEPQEAVHGSEAENIESQESNYAKVNDICRREEISELVDVSEECEDESKEPQKASGKRWRTKGIKIVDGNTGRTSSGNMEDDESEEGKFNLMGYSSDCSLTSPSSTTATYSYTTDESPVFDGSSMPLGNEPHAGEANCLKRILKNWLLDVTEDEESSSSSLDSLNPLKVPRDTVKESIEEKSRGRVFAEQEMLTCNFTHTRHSKSHGKAKRSADPLGRRPVIGRKKAHSYTTSLGCGTNTRVKIVKHRAERDRESADSGKVEKRIEEVYEENEVHTLMMSAKYLLDKEASHSQPESPVRDYETDDERDDERNDERDNERNGGRPFYGNCERRLHRERRNVHREPVRCFVEEDERYIYEEPEGEVVRDPQREPEGRPFEEDESYLNEEPEREVNIDPHEEPEAQVDRNFLRELEMALGKSVDWSSIPLRKRGLIPDPRTLAERFAAIAPTSFGLSESFCPTLYNRRYPYRYEEFVKTYMGINNTEKIPDETATAWLDMIYHEIESLLNYVDRIGREESYRILLEKVEDRFSQKFGRNM